MSRRVNDKLYTWLRLRKALKEWRKEGKTIVFTNGCFDILHWGHVYYLERAKALGDVLIVGVNSDASIRRLKGPGRPINPLRDRMRVLAGLESVDAVISFSSLTPIDLIRKIKPDVLVKGGDWQVKDIVGAEEVLSWGGKVLTVPLRKGRSTTAVIAKVQGGRGEGVSEVGGG